MLIADLDFALCESPARHGPPVRSLLVHLVTDTGVEGWGESTAIWRPGELTARRDIVLPLLADRNVFDLEELLLLDVLASPALRSAVEMACWDAIGRRLNQPLFRLWGGLYRPRIPVAARLPLDTAEGAARFARELAEQGFRHWIITASGQPSLDASVFQAVREAIGPVAPMRFDGARRYALDTAQVICERLQPWGVQAAIDVLTANDFVRLQELEQLTSVPLAVCGLIRGASDVAALARMSRMPQGVLDLDLIGGLTSARKCVATAEAVGASLSLAAGNSLGIAAAAQLHLAAATPSLASAHEFSAPFLQQDLLVEQLAAVDGCLRVPQSPGLGIEVDREKLERFAMT